MIRYLLVNVKAPNFYTLTIYTSSKQKVLSFGNDLATESNANVLSEI